MGILTLVRAADQYSRCSNHFGVVVKILSRWFIQIEKHDGSIQTCWADSAIRCKNPSRADLELLARVAERLTNEAATSAA